MRLTLKWRRAIKVMVAVMMVRSLALSSVTSVYAISQDMFSSASKTTAMSRISYNMQGYQPYGTGVLKISVPVLLDCYRGPVVFDSNDMRVYDEMKWVEGGGFDEIRYAADYPEVAAAFGTSHKALWDHFKTQGVYEGRIAHYKCVFDGNTYICGWKYKDVEAICLAQECCNGSMSDYEKVLAINNEMCARFSYDFDLKHGKLPMTGTGICDDYARFCVESVLATGIPCAYITANNHAWNEVYVDGCWKVVDVTWDDLNNNKYFMIDSHPKEL